MMVIKLIGCAISSASSSNGCDWRRALTSWKEGSLPLIHDVIYGIGLKGAALVWKFIPLPAALFHKIFEALQRQHTYCSLSWTVFSIFIKRNKPEHLDWICWSKPQAGNDNFIIDEQCKVLASALEDEKMRRKYTDWGIYGTTKHKSDAVLAILALSRAKF